ncbi:MAG: CoxG family protein [Halorhabdus sp.]
MTVRLERVVDLPAPREEVWAFISDPAQRARHISVVDDYSIDGDGRATWQLALPIPLVDRTIAVKTKDVDVRPPEHVKFVGRSRVMQVVGEQDLEPTETGSRLKNSFTVEGKVPGVERFFESNLEDEFDNLESGLREFLHDN